MKVLVVFANPRGTSSLRLGEEDKTIQECIRRSKQRDTFNIVPHHAATVDDVRRALLDDDFQIIHFSGHGTRAGLVFEDRNGSLYVPPRDALADLLADFAPPLECVLLNACYSLSQGEFTSVGVPYTIAMERPISDDAAIIFTGAFYDSIGAGKDVEFSFKQGLHALRLANHPDSLVPFLLRKGETIRREVSTEQPLNTRSVNDGANRALLIGIGLDVSGSMESSIRNRSGQEQSRIEAFQVALKQSLERSKAVLESSRGPALPVYIFAYAFGLRAGSVGDLFSLIRAAENLIPPAEIERLKARYTADIKARYSGSNLGGLESLARSYGFGGFVDSAKAQARASAEAEVKNRILAEVQRRLSERLNQIGDTTLQLQDLASLWKNSSASISEAEALIFGNTPMREALEKMYARFRTELDKYAHGKEITSILLLVSDGDPTDGDPEPPAENIRSLGVTIVSCYITDSDVSSPRVLKASPDDKWPEGAKRLFRMSSVIELNSPLSHYLLRQGWTIEDGAKCFIQVNHSEVLEEFVDFALSPVEEGYTLLPKGV